MSKHTLTVLVENKPGVLARIAGLFSRRGFNIDSLAVGPTEHPEVSRMTIVVNVEDSPLEQVTKQLNKLVEVIKIVELDGSASVNRELLLVKVKADAETRGQVLDAVQLFRAKVVDVAPDAVTIEVTGNTDKLADFLRVLEPFGIRELVQSGMVAIGRGSRSISERTLRPVPVPAPPAAKPADLSPVGRGKVPGRTPSYPIQENQPEGEPPVAEMFYDDDADLSLIQGKNVAVLGYGSQGHAHSLSLRDSGVDVRIGLPEGSKSRAKAEAEGLRVLTPAEAVEEADVIVILAPDHVQRKLYAESVEPNLDPGRHPGVRPRLQHPLRLHHPARGRRRRSWSPPRAPATWSAASTSTVAACRCSSRSRRTPPARPGTSRCPTRRRSAACAPAASRPRSPRRPRPTCSASRPCSAVAPRSWCMYGFEVLTEAGYQPEVAYFECLHELKLIVDLMYEGGIAKQRWSVSDTAEYGDYVSGPRVIDEHVKENMKAVLEDIKNGSFAQRFIDDQDAGAPEFKKFREQAEAAPDREDRPRAAQAHVLGEEPRLRLRRGHLRPLITPESA